MIFALEIALIILGLIALITGNLTITPECRVKGTPARVIGLVGLLPLPLTIVVALTVGLWHGVQNRGLDDSVKFLLLLFEVGITLGSLVVMVVLTVSFGVKGKRKRARLAAHHDDDDSDRQPERPWRSDDVPIKKKGGNVAGIIVLGVGLLMLATCALGVVGFGAYHFLFRAKPGEVHFRAENPPDRANPFQAPVAPAQAAVKPIPKEWDDATMQWSFLSDLQEFEVRVGWGTFGKKGNLGYRGHGSTNISVNDKFFPNSISMHPPSSGASSVKYRLNRQAKLFRATVAINDADEPGITPGSTPTFRVLGDNASLWASNPIRKGVSEDCRINVEGVEVMELQVHCPGRFENVRAVWLDPIILK